METLFLILSGAILLAGVVYWLWSHIQLTQKKVQLLENAVFELRAMIPPGGGTAGPPLSVSMMAGPSSVPTPVTAPPAAKPYTDLGDDDWEDTPVTAEVPTVSTPLEKIDNAVPTLITREAEMDLVAEEATDDLMPGGRISLGPESGSGSGSDVALKAEEAQATADTDQFKQLFAAEPRPALEGMPLKELRRLGEQRGIVGAAEMRKKELLATLRQQVSVPSPTVPASAATITEEPATKELDLDAVEAEEAEMLE